MKVAVVGNRQGWNEGFVFAKLAELLSEKDEIVSGGALGVDTYAQNFARGCGKKITIFYPDLKQPSPDRYYKRNSDIVNYSDKVIAFSKGTKSGTQNTINWAKKKGIEIVVIKHE